MRQSPELFGLMLFSHGWARILTVMSPQGVGAVLDRIKPGVGLRVESGDGRLPQFHEIQKGALGKLIVDYGITVLDKPEWDEKKRQFGDSVYF